MRSLWKCSQRSNYLDKRTDRRLRMPLPYLQSTKTLRSVIAKETKEKTKMNTSWQDKANCQGADTDIFFPDHITPDPPDEAWNGARSYCGSCPVKQHCLDFVLIFERSSRRRDGFWANMTPRQRSQYEKTLAK